LAGALGGFSLTGVAAEVAQDHASALADELLRNLVNRCQNSAHYVRDCVIRNRTVGNSKMCLLAESGSIDFQFDVFDPRCRTALKRRVDERLQHMPDFRPDFAHRLTERPGMFKPKYRSIGIVVETDIV